VPEEVFLGRLARLARERPHDEAVLFVDGPTWTWSQLDAAAASHAAGLQALGVQPGERVLSWLPNGPTALLNLLGLARLGAVCVPINTGYRGALLEHVLANSGARRLIAHGALLERLAGVDTGALESVVVLGPERPALPGIAMHDAAVLRGDAARLVPPPRPPEPWDTLTVIYTSGTTGPSKGVLMSYRHAECAARGFRNIGPGDRNLACLPMFHVGGVLSLLWAVLHEGASVVYAEGFRTAEFWAMVQRHRITTTGLLGSMVDFLNAQPRRDDERAHGLRSVLIAPYGASAIAFGERFGVPVYTEFNMSELSVPLFAGPDPGVAGTCGLPAPGVTLRIVDADDCEVAAGAVGELVLRMDEPWTISHGYLDDAAATARAWRNGWFHTGDLFRRDASGHYFFVDRIADAIRRRGENVSAFEVEQALRLLPGVVEAAVVGVPAPEGSEQEVLAVLRLAEGTVFDPAALLDALRPRLAPFMLPRYFRAVADFPRTPTQKIEKHRLRATGLTADTWDRERAGATVRRDRLERRG
jgi:crotonobetaine/carnitine-CoA ligase